MLCHYNGTRPPPQLLVHETTRTSRRTPRSSAPRMKTWSAASAAPSGARWRKRCRPVSEDIRPGKLGRSLLRPYKQRLAQAIRQDVEKALQGDQQLGEQVAQILSSRRFDNDAPAQNVPLISDRAQQLVPGAAKRVLNEWTQNTLAAHRGRTQRADSASVADVAPASVLARPAGSEQRPARRQDAPRSSGQASVTRSHPVNYRKLSDEQILDM